MSKTLKNMTLEDLVQGIEHWTRVIGDANQWGVTPSGADDFRRELQREMNRRRVGVLRRDSGA